MGSQTGGRGEHGSASGLPPVSRHDKSFGGVPAFATSCCASATSSHTGRACVAIFRINLPGTRREKRERERERPVVHPTFVSCPRFDFPYFRVGPPFLVRHVSDTLGSFHLRGPIRWAYRLARHGSRLTMPPSPGRGRAQYRKDTGECALVRDLASDKAKLKSASACAAS